MPEPFSGRSACAGVAFVGANPGFLASEIGFPGPETGFDEFHKFFRFRFDVDRRRGAAEQFDRKHQAYWFSIERFLRDLNPGFRLGYDAFLIEIVRFKSKGLGGAKGPKRVHWRRALDELERHVFVNTLRNLEVDVLITLGAFAATEIQKCIDFDPCCERPDFRPSAAENDFGRIFCAEFGRGRRRRRVFVLPLVHPNCRVRYGLNGWATWWNHPSQNRARANLAALLQRLGRL